MASLLAISPFYILRGYFPGVSKMDISKIYSSQSRYYE